MANAKKLNLHRALDLAIQVCAYASRKGWYVYDIDKLHGAKGVSPALRVKAVAVDLDGSYAKGERIIPLTGDGFTLDFSMKDPRAKEWAVTCAGGGKCVRCPDKADCAARANRWIMSRGE